MDREETNLRLLTAGLVDGLLVASTMEDFARLDGLPWQTRMASQPRSSSRSRQGQAV